MKLLHYISWLALLPAMTVHAQDNVAASVAQDEVECLQKAADVVAFDDLGDQGPISGKLFALGGGDPAINGLLIYLQLQVSPAGGSSIFLIGDFSSYRLISERPGQLVLKVDEQDIDPKNGEVIARERKLLVRWTIADEEKAPEEIEIISTD